MTTTIAITSERGVGKTTIAVNLALSLVYKIKKPLLDADLGMANAHILLGINQIFFEDFVGKSPMIK